jgi:hypothetical protein
LVAGSTHLHVFFGSLLPLLGHGARPLGIGEHAGETEEENGSTDNTSAEEKDIATLIGGGRSAGTMGTKGNVVCCSQEYRVSLVDFQRSYERH